MRGNVTLSSAMSAVRQASAGQSEPHTPSGGAVIDLSCLCQMYPQLPGDMVVIMVIRAALGLQRNGHSPGADLQMSIERVVSRCALLWPAADLATAEQHDYNRITEDGAEAIALAVAHKTMAWRLVRRIQQEGHGDWLLEHQHKGMRKLVAFEVSGVDTGSIRGRLREKLAQVAKTVDVDERWAGVIGFQRPEAALQSVKL